MLLSVRYNFRASCIQGALYAKATVAQELLAHHSFTLRAPASQPPHSAVPRPPGPWGLRLCLRPMVCRASVPKPTLVLGHAGTGGAVGGLPVHVVGCIQQITLPRLIATADVHNKAPSPIRLVSGTEKKEVPFTPTSTQRMRILRWSSTHYTRQSIT